MTQREAEVWLFYPEGGGPTAKTRRWIESQCESRGWSLNLRPTGKTRSPEGRPLGPIKNEDATNLYRRIHRVRVGVWQIDAAHVPIKPQPKIVVRDYVPLHRFIAHKAFHRRIPMEGFETQWSSSLAAFSAWLEQVGCEGESDPRCLPFPVFDTKFDISELATQEGRSAFALIHGPQSSRIDHNQLRWHRGPYHGHTQLQVAGRNLAPGFHWDVMNQRTEQRITTTSEVWRIGKNGYVNVYPDQHIRQGHSSKRVLLAKKAKAR